MKFLTQIYDFMFAPAGTFDSDSGPSLDTSSDNDSVEHGYVMVNPANGMPMIDGSGGLSGIDVLGNPYGVALHSHHETDHSRTFSHDDCSPVADNFEPVFDSCSMFDSSPMVDSGSMFECGSPSFGTGFDD
jgi:hypothetical protein